MTPTYMQQRQQTPTPNVIDLIDFFGDETGATSNNGKSELVHNNGHIFELHQSDSLGGCVEIGLKNGPNHLDDLILRKNSTGTTQSGCSDSDVASGDGSHAEAPIAADADDFRLQMAKSSFDQGVTYWSAKEYDLALVEFRRCLELREAVLGKYHEDTYQSYYWIATVYWHKSEHQKALEMFCHALQIKYTMNDGDVDRCGVVNGWISNSLDALHMRDGDIEEYWSMLIKGFDHEQKGDEHMNNGKHKHANQEYRTALALHQRRRTMLINSSPLAAKLINQPAAQPELAHLHTKIGDGYSQQGLFDRSMVSHRKALGVYMIRYGPYSTFTATALNHFREAALKYGWSDKAVDEYCGVLEKSVLHEVNADMMLMQKNFDVAMREYGAALALEESSVVGRLQLPSASMYCKVGSLLADRDEFDGALPHFGKALGIYHSSSKGKSNHEVTNTSKLIRKLLHRQCKMKAHASNVNESVHTKA